MPLTQSLFAWIRSRFTGRPQATQAVLALAVITFGWIFVIGGAIVTAVADLVGATGRGKHVHPIARLGIGALVLVVLGAVLPESPTQSDTAALGPTPILTHAVVTPAPTPADVATSPPSASAPEPVPTTSLPPSPTPTPAPTASPATASPRPSAATSASAIDPMGDQFDENGDPINGVDYQDIVAGTAAWQGLRLHLSIDVLAALPAVDPLVEVITFAWLLDTDVDGQPEWLLVVENLDEPAEENAPGWGAALTRMDDGQTLAGPEFPGTLVIDGRRVILTTDLYARSSRVGIASTTEHTIWEGPLEATTVTDDLPDSQWPEGNDWIVIATD